MTMPPWIFLGFYVLEDWFGIIALVIVPVVILIGLVLVPYLDRNEDIHSTMRKAVVWSYKLGVLVMIDKGTMELGDAKRKSVFQLSHFIPKRRLKQCNTQ